MNAWLPTVRFQSAATIAGDSRMFASEATIAPWAWNTVLAAPVRTRSGTFAEQSLLGVKSGFLTPPFQPGPIRRLQRRRLRRRLISGVQLDRPCVRGQHGLDEHEAERNDDDAARNDLVGFMR